MNIVALLCSIMFGGSISLIGSFCLWITTNHWIPLHPLTPQYLIDYLIIISVIMILLGIITIIWSYPLIVKDLTV